MRQQLAAAVDVDGGDAGVRAGTTAPAWSHSTAVCSALPTAMSSLTATISALSFGFGWVTLVHVLSGARKKLLDTCSCAMPAERVTVPFDVMPVGSR